MEGVIIVLQQSGLGEYGNICMCDKEMQICMTDALVLSRTNIREIGTEGDDNR